MKIKTVLIAAIAGGAGYVLGTRAGHGKFEELKAKANNLAHSQQAQDAAAKVAAGVKKNADKLPDPVAGVATSAADKVADAPKTDQDESTSSTDQSGTSSDSTNP